jgi:alanyl-tRNA synthetase
VRSDVEEAANQAIRKDLSVSASIMPLAKAREIGALALFGETYDEDVRVVEMGGPWSRELCGGTHVQHTAQIGLVTITGESSVGSGVRRVEAFVGIEAFRYLAKERSLVLELSEALKVQPEQLPDRIGKLVAQLKDAEKRIADLRSKTVLSDVGSIAAKSHDMWGVGYIAHRADGVSGNDLRTLAVEVRNRVQDSAAVVAVVGGAVDKPSVVIVTTEAARDRGLDAGELVRVAAETLGGRGGGKADIAQGGGTDGARAEDALKSVEYAIGRTLQS